MVGEVKDCTKISYVEFENICSEIGIALDYEREENRICFGIFNSEAFTWEDVDWKEPLSEHFGVNMENVFVEQEGNAEGLIEMKKELFVFLLYSHNE